MSGKNCVTIENNIDLVTHNFLTFLSSLSHGQETWFNDECDILRKKCLLIKNSLRYANTSDPQYKSFHEHVQQNKKLVSKTKLKNSESKRILEHFEIRNKL